MEKIFHCVLCPFNASNDAGLQMHIKRVHNEKKKTAEKTIKTKYETTNDEKENHNEKIFRCDLCPLNASNDADLQIHIKLVHSEKKIQASDMNFIEKDIKTRKRLVEGNSKTNNDLSNSPPNKEEKTLKTAKRIVLGTPQNRYSCDQCGMKIKLLQSLKNTCKSIKCLKTR